MCNWRVIASDALAEVVMIAVTRPMGNVKLGKARD